jgi:hypothetical protein
MGQRSLNRRSRRDEPEDEAYDERDEYKDDDADEEPPRGRRGRSRRSEDEDEAPRGRRSSRRDEDEDDEPPRGRRSSRRGRDDDDDEERTPRSTRRRGRDDDDADDEPKGRSRNTGKGWGAYKSKRSETSDFVKNYQLPEDQEEIVKVLDEEPFLVINEHWLDDLPKGHKKSHVCLGEGCPACNAGDKAKTYVYFNVADLRDPDNPVVAPWKISPMTADVLENYAKSERTKPLNRDDLYFSIQKTGGGKKGRVTVNVHPVKARDLKEDWDIEPLSSKEVGEFVLFTEDDVVEYTSKSKLRELVNLLDD